MYICTEVQIQCQNMNTNKQIEVITSSELHCISGNLFKFVLKHHQGDTQTKMHIKQSHEAQNALISWEAVGPRIIYASFKRKKENIKVNIILSYAPTNDKNEETKENFYNKLQTLCDKLKEKDMTILMGDLNAKIGSDNSGYEEVMGRQNLVK